MRVLTACVTAAALALGAASFPVAAQEGGEVPTVDPKQPPWSAIGRVNRFGGEFCTGALIGPRHVLTVAHCLYDRERGQWVDPGDVQFVAGYHRGDFAAHALVAQFILPPAFRPDQPLDGDNLAEDWAVLVLSSAPAVRPLPWLAVSPGQLAARTGDRTSLMRVGYTRRQPHVMAAFADCAFLVIGASLLSHDCDVTIDDSGSPLLLRRQGQLYIVGVSVAARGGGPGQIGVALPIDNFADEIGRALSAP